MKILKRTKLKSLKKVELKGVDNNKNNSFGSNELKVPKNIIK